MVVSFSVVMGADGFAPEVLEASDVGEVRPMLEDMVVDDAETFVVVSWRMEAVEEKGVL